MVSKYSEHSGNGTRRCGVYAYDGSMRVIGADHDRVQLVIGMEVGAVFRRARQKTGVFYSRREWQRGCVRHDTIQNPSPKRVAKVFMPSLASLELADPRAAKRVKIRIGTRSKRTIASPYHMIACNIGVP